MPGNQSYCRRGQGKSRGFFPTGASDKSLKLKRREGHRLCVLMSGVLSGGRDGKQRITAATAQGLKEEQPRAQGFKEA